MTYKRQPTTSCSILYEIKQILFETFFFFKLLVDEIKRPIYENKC